MRRSPNQPPWKEDDEPKSIVDCYFVSFDIGENLDVPTAIVGKQTSAGFIPIRIFQEDDAIALFETLTGEELEL